MKVEFVLVETVQVGNPLYVALRVEGQHLSKQCLLFLRDSSTVKLGNKERFDKELIGIKEPFPVTNLPFTS